MKIPRSVNGRDLANHLIRNWRFIELRQRGSHIILRSDVPVPHTVSIPAHKPLKAGTFRDILSYIVSHKSVTISDLLRDL